MENILHDKFDMFLSKCIEHLLVYLKKYIYISDPLGSSITNSTQITLIRSLPNRFGNQRF